MKALFPDRFGYAAKAQDLRRERIALEHSAYGWSPIQVEELASRFAAAVSSLASLAATIRNLRNGALPGFAPGGFDCGEGSRIGGLRVAQEGEPVIPRKR